MDVGQGHVANSRCVTAMAPQEQALGQLPGAGPAEGAEFPRSSEVKELLERLWREQRGWGAVAQVARGTESHRRGAGGRQRDTRVRLVRDESPARLPVLHKDPRSFCDLAPRGVSIS